MPGSFRKFLFFTIVLLLGIGGLLYMADIKRVENLDKERNAETRYAVRQATALIGQEIIQLRRSVYLFALSYAQQLEALIIAPDDDKLRTEIQAKVEQHFPGAFTYMLADTDGNALLVDFDNMIGEQCRDNLRDFSAGNKTDLRIHPSNEAYHFDIMTPFAYAGDKSIFFISFHASLLSSYLEAPPGHELILVHKDKGRLIELTATGSRDKLQGVNHLTDSERESARYSRQISGTSWELLDVTRQPPGYKSGPVLRTESAMIFIVFALVSFVALLAIYFDDRRLDQAMRAIEEHKQELEERIRFRTEELSEANRELHHLSTRDSLTGVANRRHFDSEIEREVHRTRRDGQPLSLLMIDVDFFKGYNDSKGHPAGDRCLASVAEVLSENMHRSSDLIARYGGEEFVVILPGMDKTQAMSFAENLRQKVQSKKLDHPSSTISEYVTISTGVATLPADSVLEARDLVEAADQSLYTAKDNGRNRVVWYQSSMTGETDPLNSGA